MNTKITRILMMALSVAALSSCSSAYRMGQTPDDVYFSPARAQAVAHQQDEYLSAPGNAQRYNGSNGVNAYNDYDNDYRNDRFLRMSMGNRMRLSAFNDFYYNDPYYAGMGFNNYGGSFNSPWNSYYYWNNYYNPYSSFNLYSPFYGGGYGSGYGVGGYGGGGWYGGGTIGLPSKTPVSVNNSLRSGTFNRSTYMNNNFSNNNRYLDRNSSATRPNSTSAGNRYNNSNNSYLNTNGSSNRRQSTYENNSNNTRSNNTRSNDTYTQPTRSYEAPTRSYSPSSSGSSSGSSSSGGGGGVSRPTRN